MHTKIDSRSQLSTHSENICPKDDTLRNITNLRGGKRWKIKCYFHLLRERNQFLVLFLNLNFLSPMFKSFHQCSTFAAHIPWPLSVCRGHHRNNDQEIWGEHGEFLTSLMSLWYLLFISSVLMSSFLVVSASCSTSPTREDSAAKRSFICAIS